MVKESNATQFRTFFGTNPNVWTRIWLLIDPYATMPSGGGFCGFFCCDAWWLNIRSNAHASRTKVQTFSSNFFENKLKLSSKLLRTCFEQSLNKVWRSSKKKLERFVRRTSNFFESCEKKKLFVIYLIFVKFSIFFEKKNFPGGPLQG